MGNNTKYLANQWAGTVCLLDGKPAIIQGRLNDSATVSALDGSKSVEFSWETVDRIMLLHDRRFNS